MAANVLLRASDSVRDRMAAEILNAAAPRLTGTLEKLAADNGHSLQGAGPARDRRTKIKESAAPESLDFRGLRRFREKQKSPEDRSLRGKMPYPDHRPATFEGRQTKARISGGKLLHDAAAATRRMPAVLLRD